LGKSVLACSAILKELTVIGVPHLSGTDLLCSVMEEEPVIRVATAHTVIRFQSAAAGVLRIYAACS
jgi:hypothetical protein